MIAHKKSKKEAEKKKLIIIIIIIIITQKIKLLNFYQINVFLETIKLKFKCKKR